MMTIDLVYSANMYQASNRCVQLIPKEELIHTCMIVLLFPSFALSFYLLILIQDLISQTEPSSGEQLGGQKFSGGCASHSSPGRGGSALVLSPGTDRGNDNLAPLLPLRHDCKETKTYGPPCRDVHPVIVCELYCTGLHYSGGRCRGPSPNDFCYCVKCWGHCPGKKKINKVLLYMFSWYDFFSDFLIQLELLKRWDLGQDLCGVIAKLVV